MEKQQSLLKRPENCDQCGACCLDESPALYQDEIDRLPPHIIERGGLKLHHGACVWFDLSTGRCLHHEHRPRTCQMVEVGSPLCLLSRLWAELALHWSDEERRIIPKQGDFSAFCQRIHFSDTRTLQIARIDGFSDPASQRAIARYNALVQEEKDNSGDSA